MRPITPSRMADAMLASVMMVAANISANADEVRVTSSNALKPVWEQVAPEFEIATGHKLVFTWGQADILKGTSFDVAVLTAAVIDRLITQGRLIGGTRRAVAVSAAGLAVRKGAAKPDISTVDSFKRTLLNASSISFAEQGGTGAYLMALFRRLGIADAVTGKLRRLRPEQGPRASRCRWRCRDWPYSNQRNSAFCGRRARGTAAERSPAYHHLCGRYWRRYIACGGRRRADQIHHRTGRRTHLQSQRPRSRRLKER